MQNLLDRDVKVSPGVYLLAAFAVLIIPLRMILCWFIAAITHELGHLVALKLCGVKIKSIHIHHSGAVINSSNLSDIEALFCTAAGPLIGVIPVLFSKQAPVLAVCAFCQTVYNLYPIPGNDGDRLLSVLLQMIIPLRSGALLKAIRCIVLILTNGLCIYATFNLKLGPLPLVTAGYLTARSID